MKIIFDGKNDASFHMQKDRELFSSFDEPILRFYEFYPHSITYGYFIDPSQHLHDTAKQHFHLAKRPTGGGVLFHAGDFSFSLLIPRSDPRFSEDIVTNYRWINMHVLDALKSMLPELASNLFLHEKGSVPASFCMAEKSSCDLLLNSKKVGAAAQRKSKKGFLHQCSLFFSPLPWNTIERVVKDAHVVHELQNTSSTLHLPENRFPEFADRLIKAFESDVPEPAKNHWIYNNPNAVASLMKGIKDIEEGRIEDRGSFKKYAND